jgi:hypothetical protein
MPILKHFFSSFRYLQSERAHDKMSALVITRDSTINREMSLAAFTREGGILNIN